jgi:hypothetical protein
MKIHMKRKHGGFFPVRPSAQSVQFGQRTVADSVGNTFQPRYLPQQAPLTSSQYFSRPMLTMDIQKHGEFLHQETIPKIDEFQRLMDKYSRYHMNPDGIIQCAIYNSINGDDTLLDEKLEQLRSMDRSLNGRAGPRTVF